MSHLGPYTQSMNDQARDAARYRWLRDALDTEEVTARLHEAFQQGSTALDEAIDKARIGDGLAMPAAPLGYATIPAEPTHDVYEKFLGRVLLNMDKPHYERWSRIYREVVATLGVGAVPAFHPCSFCKTPDACGKSGCADAAIGREIAARGVTGTLTDEEKADCGLLSELDEGGLGAQASDEFKPDWANYEQGRKDGRAEVLDGEHLPRHKFWGAGEPDCPQELKAPNGELHTMRCKVCGDGWRKSRDVCLAARGVAIPSAPLEAISSLLRDVLAMPGMNSRTAPDYAVEVALWLSHMPIPAVPMLDERQSFLQWARNTGKHDFYVLSSAAWDAWQARAAYGVAGTPAAQPSEGSDAA